MTSPSVTWENLIPDEHRSTYRCVLECLRREGIPFALGGGLALSYYTGHLRHTKDLDIYVRPEYRRRVIDMVTGCGLKDYHEVAGYDRAWIYRAYRDNVIVDTIWAMANQRAHVDDIWTRTGPRIHLFGQDLRVVPPEELFWSKLYVLQRDRCDWPDIMNLVCSTGRDLDWEHLLNRVAEDHPLLRGVLSVMAWVAPERAMELPGCVWDLLGLPSPRPVTDPPERPARQDLLDSRPWLLAA